MNATITREVPLGKNDWISETVFNHGPQDKETFTTCHVELSDGRTVGAVKSDKRPGFFKRVFVPFDMENPSFIA